MRADLGSRTELDAAAFARAHSDEPEPPDDYDPSDYLATLRRDVERYAAMAREAKERDRKREEARAS